MHTLASKILLVYQYTKSIILALLTKLLIRPMEQMDYCIIRPGLIGDFYLWLPIAIELKKQKPNAKILYIGHESLLPIIKKYEIATAVIAYNPINFQQKTNTQWQICKAVRKHRFKKLLYPSYSREFIKGDLISWVVKAEEKMAFIGDELNQRSTFKRLSNLWYTSLLKAPQNEELEGKLNWHIAKQAFGIKETVQNNFVPKQKVKKSNERQIAVIAPAASSKIREWSPLNYINIARYIKEKSEMNVLYLGPGGLKQKINEALTPDEIEENQLGKTSLVQLDQLIYKANLVIGNESAPVHIARFHGVPNISICGGGHFGRFLHFNNEPEKQFYTVYHKMECFACNWRCKYKTHSDEGPAPCITNITFDEVKHYVDKIMSEAA